MCEGAANNTFEVNLREAFPIKCSSGTHLRAGSLCYFQQTSMFDFSFQRTSVFDFSFPDVP